MFKKNNFILSNQSNFALFNKHILPLFNEKNINIYTYNTLSITNLFNNDYWMKFNNIDLNNSINKIDYRTWFLTDKEFLYYCDKISQTKMHFLQIFSNPYGYENNLDFDINDFDKKLDERTKLLVSKIRDSSDIKTISPFITINNTQHERYLDFLINNRELFDYWAIDCSGIQNEQNISLLNSLVTQCLYAIKKPTLILKWNVSSCEHQITTKNSMIPINEKLLTHEQARNLLHNIYSSIEKIINTDSYWFYSGSIVDLYNPNQTPAKKYWSDNFESIKNNNDMWQLSDFTGLLTYNEKIKTPIVKELIEIFS